MTRKVVFRRRPEPILLQTDKKVHTTTSHEWQDAHKNLKIVLVRFNAT